jgi:hypothetical protein
VTTAAAEGHVMTLEQQESADPGAATSPRVFITHSHDDEHHKRSLPTWSARSPVCPVSTGRNPGAAREAGSGAVPLASTLRPVRCGLDLRQDDVRINGVTHAGSIVYRPSVFALQTEGVVEYDASRSRVGQPDAV